MDGSKDQFKAKRKGALKTVMIGVKIDESSGKLRSEGPPSDSWSWRKYGQKPIKGSPYPRLFFPRQFSIRFKISSDIGTSCRGYYRCSTSKGCSAKKQVERCRADASMLIITYTSTHNHPGGPHADDDDHRLITQKNPKDPNIEEISLLPTTANTQDDPEELKREKEDQFQDPTSTHEEDHIFHYVQSSIPSSHDKHDTTTNPFTELCLVSETTQGSLSLLLDEEQEPLSYPHLMTFSSTIPTSEEDNGFFDELGELPASSSFITSFTRNNFFDERILVFPS